LVSRVLDLKTHILTKGEIETSREGGEDFLGGQALGEGREEENLGGKGEGEERIRSKLSRERENLSHKFLFQNHWDGRINRGVGTFEGDSSGREEVLGEGRRTDGEET